MNVLTRSAIAIVALITGLSGCGGGGRDSGGNTTTGVDTVASIVSPIAAACNQGNFTRENFNTIAVGMSLDEVTRVIGCESTSNAMTTGFVIYGWTYGASLINVFFDPASGVVTEFGGQYKTAVNLNSPTSLDVAACTQSNFTVKNFNAIAVGMTLDQVSQAVGCQSNSNGLASGLVLFGWGYGASLINVYFDPTGATVVELAGEHKKAVNLNIPGSQGLPACDQSNFTEENFNGIAVGMTLDQVNQVIGCNSTSNALTSDLVIFGWAYGSSLVSVYFDSTGSLVTQFGNEFKTAVNLNTPEIPSLPTCGQSNLTMEKFNAIDVGMTLDEVSQVIGCQGMSSGVTSSFVTYGWMHGSSLINVLFDPTGTTVTAFGGQHKTAVNLNIPGTAGLPACGPGNLTSENFNTIAIGMTVDQVSQTIGCQSNSNGVTSGFVIFGWGYGPSLINTYFDPTGTSVTASGGQYKSAVNLN